MFPGRATDPAAAAKAFAWPCERRPTSFWLPRIGASLKKTLFQIIATVAFIPMKLLSREIINLLSKAPTISATNRTFTHLP
jgi:hypothetical protein